jgi:hypothetical protein
MTKLEFGGRNSEVGKRKQLDNIKLKSKTLLQRTYLTGNRQVESHTTAKDQPNYTPFSLYCLIKNAPAYPSTLVRFGSLPIPP